MAESISHEAASDPAAIAEIAQLRRGADPAWMSAYLDGSHPSHRAALDRFNNLHERAYGASAAEASGAPAAPAGPASAPPARDGAGPEEGEPVSIQFPPDAYKNLFVRMPEGSSPDAVIAVNVAAREAASLLGFEPAETKGHAELLDQAVTRRGGRDMDEFELGTMEAMLQSKAGDEYGDIVKGFDAAIRRAGKHGEWLRRSILAADPTTAARLILTLGRRRH